MQYILFILSSFYLIGCMELAPEAEHSKSSIANKEIINTQHDAKQAQKEYIALQKSRGVN